MAYPQCPMTPDTANFATAAPDAVVYVDLDGGLGASRLDKVNASTKVTVTWSLSGADWATLYTFWETTLVYGSLPMTIGLVLAGNVLTNYTAKFIGGGKASQTFGLQSVQGDTYVVQATLEAIGA